MLDAQEKWERASACFVLGEIGAIQVVPVLKKALEDPEDVVRGNAIKALAKCGESILISEFIGEYPKETEVVRQAIVFSVRFFEGEVFRNFIMEHLKDGNDDISLEAAYSFNHMVHSQPQLLSQLKENLENLSPEVLSVIVEGISNVYDINALEILERLSYYPDIGISTKATEYYKKVSKNCGRRI
ncbi:MAG: HEAT repeat domain-containing protein, partial [Candidatus Muiribacteriaceae bacterium]